MKAWFIPPTVVPIALLIVVMIVGVLRAAA